MTHDYDFEMVKRAYAEIARRAREKDEVRRAGRYGHSQSAGHDARGGTAHQNTVSDSD